MKSHLMTYKAEGFIDQIFCSCGWESPKYWDGYEYAEQDFKRHVSKARVKEREEGT